MELKSLIELAVEEGFVYLYKHGEGRLACTPLEVAVEKYEGRRAMMALSPAKLELMINNTLSNYSRIKRNCTISQDPMSCYTAETVLPELESIFENFEYGMGILEVWKTDDADDDEPFLVIKKQEVGKVMRQSDNSLRGR